MKIIGLAYHTVNASQGRGPKTIEELEKAFKPDASAIQRIKNGEIVVRWGLRIPGSFPEGTSNTVLLYEKDVPTQGGAVVMGDAGFRMMTAEEFKNSPLPVSGEQRRQDSR
jgi:hypothetical protein